MRLVDIHSHLLPGVDDGVQSQEEALEILQQYSENGVDTIIVTPHLHDPYVTTNVSAIRGSYQWLKERGRELGIDIYLGSELYMGASGGKYIPFFDSFQLIETDTSVEPLFLLDRVFELQMSGLSIILAHIERYQWFSLESVIAKRLREMGVYFQVNVSSLDSKQAQQYIEAGWVDFIASDNHGKRRGAVDFEAWKSHETILQRSVEILTGRG